MTLLPNRVHVVGALAERRAGAVTHGHGVDRCDVLAVGVSLLANHDAAHVEIVGRDARHGALELTLVGGPDVGRGDLAGRVERGVRVEPHELVGARAAVPRALGERHQVGADPVRPGARDLAAAIPTTGAQQRRNRHPSHGGTVRRARAEGKLNGGVG